MSSELLSFQAMEPASPAQCVVIWLHGLGANGSDFLDIVPQLRLPVHSGIRFIFPNAPVRPVTLNGGYPMQAWYDITGLSLEAREDEVGIQESEEALGKLIKEVHKSGIPYEKIILAGFSQGGAMVLYSGLRYQQALGGILVLSGYLLLAAKIPSSVKSANQDTPILMAHGLFDQIVPEAWGQLSRDKLRTLGYSPDWRVYPMEHTLCPDEIKDISTWLQRSSG